MKVINSDRTLHWTKLKGVICRNRQSLKVAQNYRGQHDCLLLLTVLFPVSVSAAVSKLLVEPWLTSWWESSWILTWDHRRSHRGQQSSTGLPVNITGHQTGTWSVFPASCWVNVIWWWIKVNIGSIVTSVFVKYTSWLTWSVVLITQKTQKRHSCGSWDRTTSLWRHEIHYRGDLQWQNTWQAGQERHEAAEEMPKLHVESEYFHI